MKREPGPMQHYVSIVEMRTHGWLTRFYIDDRANYLVNYSLLNSNNLAKTD